MDHEPINSEDANELEDGEISDGGYIPLVRPGEPNQTLGQGDVASSSSHMEGISDTEEMIIRQNSSDSSDSDNFNSLKRKHSEKSTLRIKPIESIVKPDTKNNKYNIWSTGLQEETLLENLQSCDVTNSKKRSRDVESYDYALKYRLNGENCMKRRQSTNSDDSESNYQSAYNKRARRNFGSHQRNNFKKKGSVKDRLGVRSDDDSSNSNSNDGIRNSPRYVLDLTVSEENSSNEDVGNDIANKLCEEKSDLMLRVVNVIGKRVAIEIFKETQRIEKDGGMLIMNGIRRRTPGGVFLFLLKKHECVTRENKKEIFIEERKSSAKDKKSQQNKNRDMKVEELKKTLKKDKDLPTLTQRKELAMSHLKPEAPYSMSNPPPSPVTDGNRENSSDYDTHTIQHVNVTSPEKAQPKEIVPVSYDDDFLDMNCDDMEL